MNPLIQLRKTTPIFLVTFLWFGFLPTVQALLPPPPPDGGYPNDNTAEGADALFSLTSGFANTAVGFEALFHNTGGDFNTAIGPGVLYHNTIGRDNTATGHGALFSNTTGSDNTATGHDALFNNSNGSANTASGVNALPNNTTGSNNTATGADALFSLTSGAHNTANGSRALESHSTGNNNTAIGYLALSNANFSPTTGSNNIALGANAGSNLTNGSNNIDIGALGSAGEANTIRIGKSGTQTATFIAGIFNATMTGSPVVINSNGKLGISGTSSARLKRAVKPMDKASEVILGLKPVSFRYKEEIDPDGIPQFGLIAEDVEKVSPELVLRDADGAVSSVRYEAVNAMLLNEFLKEHQKVQRLEAALAAMGERLKEQNAKIQRVNDRVELSKPASQTVLNNR